MPNDRRTLESDSESVSRACESRAGLTFYRKAKHESASAMKISTARVYRCGLDNTVLSKRSSHGLAWPGF